jgi:hypothetical protein
MTTPFPVVVESRVMMRWARPSSSSVSGRRLPLPLDVGAELLLLGP